MKPLRMALTKGRLEKDTVALLERIGYDCEAVHNKGRKLILPVGDRLEVVLAKAADVITYVEHGVCDLGVVGKDTIMENGTSFYEVLDLGFGRCKFALAAPKGSDFFGGYASRTIATKYPNVARNYFESKAMDIRFIKIEGSVELAPLLGLSDAIVDIVETGTTLKENGLEVVETICDISARLIVNTASLKLRKAEIEELVAQMEQAKNGELSAPTFVAKIKEYAEELDCVIEDIAGLAIYALADKYVEDGMPLTEELARQVTENAVIRADKRGLGSLFKSKYDKEGRLILKEAHFKM